MDLKEIEKLANEVKEEKAKIYRKVFSVFENADYDRGDKIVLGAWLAERIQLPDYVQDVIAVDQLGCVEPNGYVVIHTQPKLKEPPMKFQTDFSVLATPKAVFTTSCT